MAQYSNMRDLFQYSTIREVRHTDAIIHLNTGKIYKNPAPSEVGLFGVLPGITGTLMANEVIKIVTGTGEILSGKVLIFNTRNNTFTTFHVDNIRENHEIKNLRGSQ